MGNLLYPNIFLWPGEGCVTLKGIGMIAGKQNSNKVTAFIVYFFFLLAVLAVFDSIVLHKFFGWGYPKHYEQENIKRYPAPYVEFVGKPNIAGHNEYGFRGPSFQAAKPDDLKVAFFGGSTGYEGNPTISKVVEQKLAKLIGQSVFVANYSVVSSNHRQHLHGILEYLPRFCPDIIIFYGGYNETVQSAFYDPRPGYPFNYFYRGETSPFSKLLLENSAIMGEIDKRTGIFTGLKKLRDQQRPLSDDWNKKILSSYFETLMLSKNVASTIESKYFGKAKFFAFYQPYQVPKEFLSTHSEIKKQIREMDYVFDVSSEYNGLGKGVYRDIVHVNQQANELMGAKIAQITAEALRSSVARKKGIATPVVLRIDLYGIDWQGHEVYLRDDWMQKQFSPNRWSAILETMANAGTTVEQKKRMRAIWSIYQPKPVHLKAIRVYRAQIDTRPEFRGKEQSKELILEYLVEK